MDSIALVTSLYDFAKDDSRREFLRLFSKLPDREIEKYKKAGNIYLFDNDFVGELFREDGDYVEANKSDKIRSLIFSIHYADSNITELMENLDHIICGPALDDHIEAFEETYGVTFEITDPEKALALIGKCGCVMIKYIGSLSIKNVKDVKNSLSILDKCNLSIHRRTIINIETAILESGYATPGDISIISDHLTG